MKNIYYLLLIFPIFIFGQSSDQNYIKSTVYKQATATSISNPDIEQANVQINYFDGLGRPIQQIAHKQSNSGKNVIVHIEYDEFGRQVKEFLPYVSQTSSLDFDSGAQINQLNYYSTSIDPNFETTTAPFSEKILDFSPLNNVLKKTAPGDAWKKDSGHEIKFDYDVNTLSDEVFNLSANRTAGSSGAYNYNLVCAGYHNPNTLYKNVIKDENWVSGKNNTTEEYKNDLGRVVLKRTYNNLQKHDTYYVYDIVGNLIYVVPPLASDSIATVDVDTVAIPINYYKAYYINEFLNDVNGNPQSGGGGGMNIKIENHIIALTLSAGFNSATFDLTKQFYINTPVSIPDMTLGYIDFSGSHEYVVKIQNNNLFFEDFNSSNPTFYFTGLSQTLSQPVGANLGYQTVYTSNLDLSVLNPLCYQYKYDSRNRLVEKKLPGKQWEYIVYDRLDRPVATGPAFSPYGDGSNGWMITQYDVFDRVTQTGWKNLTVTETTRNTNQTLINSGSNPFVLSTNDILTKNFYDNYIFSGAPSSIPTTLPDSSLSIATNLKGMLTGSWVKTLESATSTNAEISYVLYDVRYRPVQTKKTNYYGGYTQVDSNMDWAGKTIYTITKHKRTNTDNELVIKDMFEYTDQDRIEIHKQQIISSPSMPEQLISKNTYDELGQLIIKNVGGEDITGTNSLQTVDYKYNIRGWLKSINDVDFIGTDLFAFKINYNDAETATDLYNGNISETFWKTKSDNIKRKYDYTYDHLNRLLQADYSKEGSTAFNSYLEQLTYDKNGNIQTLLRNGDMDTDGYQFEQIIDDLVYTYHPQNKNLLEKVIDKSIAPQGFNESYDLNSGDSDGIDDITIDYTYDLNGNMLSDTNKGIENIVYNHLNLPIEITFQNGKINYLYNAFGQKVKKTVTEGSTITTTDYLNGFQYKNDVLQFFPHAEGYVNATQSKTTYTFNYVFNYTDHLGNIRLSYSKDPLTSVLKIIEENHYYPFGLKHTGYNSDKMMYSRENSVLKIRPVPPSFITSYSKKFNGQSWETDLGLNITAMDYRQYDNALGRFNSMDKLAELAPGISPYRFAFNNPVFWGDPTGLIEQSVVMDIFKRSSHGQTWYNNGQDGFETSNGGYVSHTSEDTSWNSSPGNSVRMPAVTVIGNKKTGKYSEEVILGAANQIISDYLRWRDGEDDVSSHFDPWTALKIGVSTQGFQLGSRSYIKSNRFGWFNAKGKWNSSNTLIKQANGKFVTGVQGKRISKTVAGNFSKTLEAGSTKWGYVSAGLTTLEAVSDGKLTAGESAKIVISIVSTMGPIGWVYSGLDLTVSLFNNGVGVTDMIGNAIDESTGGASLKINPFD